MFNRVKIFFGEAWLFTKDIFSRWFDYVQREEPKMANAIYTPIHPVTPERVESGDVATHSLPEAKKSFIRPPVSEDGDFVKIFQCVPMNYDIEDVLRDDMLVDLKGEGVWGVEHTEMKSPVDSIFDSKYFRTHIEKGAYVRERDMIRGTGWQNTVCRAERAGLAYYVRFRDEFNFVKGGKLPGLFGGDSPSGGASADNGFTARMMWRKDGMGELYLYCMNAESEYGASSGRGNFTFTPGKWHKIEQEVVLNTPGYDDGVIRIWFDGTPVIEQTGIIFRVDDTIKIDGIMSNIFFGGGDSTWAPTRDEFVDHGSYSVYISK